MNVTIVLKIKTALNASVLDLEMKAIATITSLLLAMLFACGGGVDVDEAALAACAQAGQPFELGTGIARFEVIRPGQEIGFENGIQGGFHVWAAIRIGEVDPVDTLLEFELHQDGRQLGGRILPKTLFCADRGYEYVGVPVELFFHGSVYSVVDRPMEMRVTLTERSGQTHTASTTFVPTCCVKSD